MKHTKMKSVIDLQDFDNMYDSLLEYFIATEDEIRLVCAINGSSVDSLNSILYVKTGYRTWEQYEEMFFEGGK